MLKTAAGAVLWDAPVPMTDAADGLPYASIGVPGRDMGLKLLLDQDADGTGSPDRRPVQGRRHRGRRPADRSSLYPAVDLHRGDVKVSQGLDLSIGLTDFGEFTLLIAKRDPGQGLVWIAFAPAHRRDHHHVLPAAPAGLDAARARTAGSGSSGGPTATSTSSASSGACSTSSWRPGAPERRSSGGRDDGSR